MNNRVLQDLEKKVDQAVKLVADIRQEKEKLIRENRSLKQKLDEYLKKIEELGKTKQKVDSKTAGSAGPEADEIKDRLRKLAGKLAALEDSWN